MTRIERWILARLCDNLRPTNPIRRWAWRRIAGPPYATEQELAQIAAARKQ